jgi:hypothetical protein
MTHSIDSKLKIMTKLFRNTSDTAIAMHVTM